MKVIIGIFILILIIILIRQTKENFESPEVSSSGEVEEGASQYYKWGYKPIEDHKRRRIKKKCPKCDHVYIDNEVCNIVIDERNKCRYCDITKNKDIDKYVLKSSIPPCPDMSKYATKSMLQPSPDMDKYILKSKLPEYCESVWIDKDKYILKTKCPPQKECPDIREYNITEHPDIHKYVTKEQCKEFKKSWVQDLEEWLKDIFSGGKKKKRWGHQNFPKGYGYSPYAGYGTDNIGYSLDGS